MTLKAGIIRNKRGWDTWAAIFTMAAIAIVGLRLWATEWTSDLYILVYLIFLAGIAGLALGYSRFSAPIAFIFAAVYGTFFTGWLFGTTVEIEMTWHDRILNYLGWRLRIAIEQFNAGEIVADPILFLTLMAILLWFLGFAAAFIVIRRRSTWPALIPLGLTLLVIGHYDQDLTRNTQFLITFLFFALLLVGRFTFLHYREKWQQEGIHTTYETQLDLSKAMLILVCVLLVLSWVIPITPQQSRRYSELWERISKPWQRLRDELSNFFVPENATTFLTASYYGESMNLGTGSPVSEEIVFTVQTEAEDIAGHRNYWRARIYDSYENEDWTTSGSFPSRLLYPGTFEIRYPNWQGGRTVLYTFTTQVSRMANIYATGAPTWVSRPAEVIYQPLSNNQEDLIALIADPPMPFGEAYQVEAWISVPTINELRSSSTDYPTSMERYLELPQDFSPKIAALAAEIASEYDNPYDKAHAITRYLRNTIEYSRILPPIPEAADPLEWFLFDEQIGFCNYYASAQVLMLRSLGIPARMAVGFAQGEFDTETNTYTVRKKDSHAWPEVYFVDYGWVIFEPTASLPPIALPLGQQSTNNTSPNNQEESPLVTPLASPPLEPHILMDNLPGESLADDASKPTQTVQPPSGTQISWMLLTLILIVLLISILILQGQMPFKLEMDPLPVLIERVLIQRGKPIPAWLKRWSTIAQMSAAEKAYLTLGRTIRWMGHEVNPAETPSERAATLTELLPEAADSTAEIISEYHLDKFSNHIVNEDRARNAARLVRRLALKTRLLRFVSLKKPE